MFKAKPKYIGLAKGMNCKGAQASIAQSLKEMGYYRL